MEIDIFEIRTLPFKKHPTRKKDGMHQLKIRVYIGTKIHGRFLKKNEVEVKVIDDFGNGVLVSPSDFENINSKENLRYLVAKAESEIKRIVHRMILQDKKVNFPSLFPELYSRRLTNGNKEETDVIVSNVDVKKIFGYPVSEQLYEEFVDAVNMEMQTSDNPLTEDEIENIASGVELEIYTKKRQKIRKYMSFDA